MTNLDMYGRKLNVDEEDNDEQEYTETASMHLIS